MTFICCVWLYVRISNEDAVCNNERNFAQTSGISKSVLVQQKFEHEGIESKHFLINRNYILFLKPHTSRDCKRNSSRKRGLFQDPGRNIFRPCFPNILRRLLSHSWFFVCATFQVFQINSQTFKKFEGVSFDHRQLQSVFQWTAQANIELVCLFAVSEGQS